MTRIEAFEALFGADADQTASQEAFENIKDNPRPSSAEEVQLDVNTLDRALDFANRPAFYADGLPAGNAKTVLTACAVALVAISRPPPQPAPPVPPNPPAPPAPPAPATKSGVLNDPLADLLAGEPGGTAPAMGRVTILPPGATTHRGKRDDEDTDDEDDRPRGKKKKGKGHDRRDEPRPPPLPPRKTITPFMRRAMLLDAWPPLRDQILAAVSQARSQDPALRAQGQQALDNLRHVTKSYQEGCQEGDSHRQLGWLAQRLLEDLRDRFDLRDPDEFRSRFDIYY